MDAEAREHLRKLADAATSGPWEVGSRRDRAFRDFPSVEPAIVEEVNTAEDADFIAAARTAVPALLNLVENLEAMVALSRQNWRLWHRDWKAADAKIQRVREVLYRHEEFFNDEAMVPSERIHRALEGDA